MLPVPKINAGTYTLRMEYADGETEEVRVTVRSNETAAVEFEYQPALALTDPAAPLRPSPQPETQRRFSGGRKFGAGVLNLALGLGSFTVGDAGGGLLNNLNIGIIPDSRGVKAVQVLYQKSF